MSTWDKANTIMAYIISIMLIFIMLISSISYNVFDKTFYFKQYQKLEVGKKMGISENDLEQATTKLFRYVQGEEEDLDVRISVKGNYVQAFNSKEVAHMKDVKKLYVLLMDVQKGIFVAAIGLFVVLLIRIRYGAITLLSINYMKISFLFTIFIFIIMGFAYVDFDRFWTLFHKLVFTNDLWLLNPKTDLMIHLFPGSFFLSLIFRIAIGFMSSVMIFFGLSYGYLRIRLNKLKSEKSYVEQTNNFSK